MRIVAVHVEFGKSAVRVIKRGRLHTGRELGGTAAGDCELRAADVVLRTRRGVGTERVVDGDELRQLMNIRARRSIVVKKHTSCRRMYCPGASAEGILIAHVEPS